MTAVRSLNVEKIIAVLLSRFKLIIICAIIGAVAFWGYSKFLVTPVYTTSSMISVQNFSKEGKGNQENQKIYGSDVSGSSTLAKVLVTLFQNSDEMTSVYSGCSVTITATDFFITFSVTGNDAQKCANVANQLADLAPDIYKNHYPYGAIIPVRNAKIPSASNAPKGIQNALIGMIVGIGFACVFSILLELIDATIKVGDDIQGTYGVPIFAEVPDFETQS